MKHATWYFDVISPFAYLQAMRLGELPDDVTLSCKPTLFAGFLNHWGQLGPAEIPPKKIFTFRHSLWRARKAGIPYTTPRKHPFNPLRALRLAESADGELAVVQAIFRSIWVEGHLPDDDAGFAAMQDAAGISDGEARVSDPEVKARLLKNGEEAIAAGVFGVPTFAIDGEIFWGDDAFEMVLDYLDDPSMLATPEMAELDRLTASSERKR